jgi:23S rRNA (cytosine1962-C5)-methyltransferase
MYPPLRLRKNEDRRLRAGHLWIFSNEVDTKRTPLTGFEAGDPVTIESAQGGPLGIGYVNPHSLICARVVSRDAHATLDETLIAKRLEAALALREELYEAPFYRLLFGDSDFLPGLVLDRYGDCIVGQATTAGMDRLKETVERAVAELLEPKGMLWRNDIAVRRLEGLDEAVQEGFGEVPEQLDLVEGGVTFGVSPHHGQKTGWFYDQRANRDRLKSYVQDARVLDLYSYAGAWGLRAARDGAEKVVCVDASAPALDQLQQDAKRNGLADRVDTRCGDVAEVLKVMIATGEQFDAVILDPPAFIKRKRDMKAGTGAYQQINELAMRVLAADGFLVSCSCSYHLSADALSDVLRRSARTAHRRLQLVEQLGQGPDHPVNPAIPESRYLKGYVARVRGD